MLSPLSLARSHGRWFTSILGRVFSLMIREEGYKSSGSGENIGCIDFYVYPSLWCKTEARMVIPAVHPPTDPSSNFWIEYLLCQLKE
ncbi:uncharacterized protein [Montipora capricornis]|uniref:uncharacterized protein n=1 Tax=Montipora capricornis TaxID=246305 RepID=UPI0035F1B0E2